MPPSTALGAFFQSVDAARRLVQEEGQYPDPPDALNKTLVIGLRGGAAVLMVAAFEEFLRNMFRERLSTLVAVPPAVDFHKLPERMRVASVFASLEIAMGRRGGPRSGNRSGRLAAIRRAAQTITAELVDPKALSDIGSNPTPSAVAELFKGINMVEIFTVVRPQFDGLWGKAEANTFVADKLDEIVQRRHVVAHTADALQITRSQLNESLTFLECLATVLDDAVEASVLQLLSTAAP